MCEQAIGVGVERRRGRYYVRSLLVARSREEAHLLWTAVIKNGEIVRGKVPNGISPVVCNHYVYVDEPGDAAKGSLLRARSLRQAEIAQKQERSSQT